jgi:hypothetical protein
MKRAASASSSPRKAEEMDMASYPSVASSSSEVSYCVADLPRRSRSSGGGARDERQFRRCNVSCVFRISKFGEIQNYCQT